MSKGLRLGLVIMLLGVVGAAVAANLNGTRAAQDKPLGVSEWPAAKSCAAK